MSARSVTTFAPVPRAADDTTSVGLPAALWRRAAARLVDAAIVFFVLWALVVLRVFWFMGALSERLDPQPWGRAFVPTVAFVVLHLTYEVVFLTWNKGQTPAKEHFKIRVVRQHEPGDPGPARALGRSTLPGVAWLASPVWLALGLLALLGTAAPLSHRRAAWHDLLAGTSVVHYDRRAEEEDER